MQLPCVVHSKRRGKGALGHTVNDKPFTCGTCDKALQSVHNSLIRPRLFLLWAQQLNAKVVVVSLEQPHIRQVASFISIYTIHCGGVQLKVISHW
jgi:hypothetical protein